MPALGYPHAGQIGMRLPFEPAVVAIGVPLAVTRACTRCKGRSHKPACMRIGLAAPELWWVMLPTAGLGNSPGGHPDRDKWGSHVARPRSGIAARRILEHRHSK
jgi:hypothetical protein